MLHNSKYHLSPSGAGGPDHQTPPAPPTGAPEQPGVVPKWVMWTAAAAGLAVGFIPGLILASTSDSSGGAQEACVAAIDQADEIISVSADAMLATADAMDAISVFDFDTAERHMDTVDEAAAVVRDIRDDYHDNKDQCRG